MNKRIRLKIEKRTNKEKNMMILNQISKELTLNTVVFGGGYFLFDLGKSAVCHFTLKETPNWRYGIWQDDGYFLFGEHIELIDKFRPTATYLSFKDEVDPFIDTVQRIINDPKLYFVDSLTDGRALAAYERKELDGEEYYVGYQTVCTVNTDTGDCTYSQDPTITQDSFVEDAWQSFYQRKTEYLAKEEKDRKFAFGFFKSLPQDYDIVTAVGVRDLNKMGWNSNPRYYVDFAVKQGTSDEQLAEIVDVIEAAERSDVLITGTHNFEFMRCFTKTSSIKNHDYKFYK